MPSSGVLCTGAIADGGEATPRCRCRKLSVLVTRGAGDEDRRSGDAPHYIYLITRQTASKRCTDTVGNGLSRAVPTPRGGLPWN